MSRRPTESVDKGSYLNKHTHMAKFKGILHLWTDKCVYKIGHFCRRNVKLFLNLELSRLRKARKCIFGLCG